MRKRYTIENKGLLRTSNPKNTFTCTITILGIILLAGLAIAGFILGLSATLRIPDQISMAPTLVPSPASRRRQIDSKCSFGHENIATFIDINNNGQYDEGIDTLIFMQESCSTTEIGPKIQLVEEELIMVNDSISESIEDHVEFRGKDAILTHTANNLDADRLLIRSEMGALNDVLSLNIERIDTSFSNIETIQNQHTFLDQRVHMLEDKDIMKCDHIMRLDHNVSDFMTRLLLVENGVDITGDAVNVLINHTDTQFDRVSDSVTMMGDKVIELDVELQFLIHNVSDFMLLEADHYGITLGTRENVTELQTRQLGHSNQIEQLFQSDISINFRIDDLRLNVSNIEQQQLINTAAILLGQQTSTNIQAQVTNTALQLANAVSTMTQKIEDFEVVKVNQSYILSNVALIKDRLADIDTHIINDEEQIVFLNDKIRDIETSVDALTFVHETLPTLNQTLLTTLKDTLSLRNDTDILRVRVAAAESSIVHLNYTSTINALNISELVSELLDIESEVAHVNGIYSVHDVKINTILATLESRSTLINTTITNTQQHLDVVYGTLSGHGSGIAALENSISNEQQRNALQQTDIETIIELQTSHTAQLSDIDYNSTMVMSKQANLKGELDTIIPKTRMLEIDVAELKINMKYLKNELNDTELVYMQNLTRIDTAIVDISIQLEDLKQQVEDHINSPTPTPTPTTTNTANYGPCARGYVHHDGTTAKSANSNVVRTGVGRFSIIFDEAKEDNLYTVLLQPEEESSPGFAVDDVQIHVISNTRTSNGFSLHIVRQDQGTGNSNNIPYEDRAFSYLVYC